MGDGGWGSMVRVGWVTMRWQGGPACELGSGGPGQHEGWLVSFPDDFSLSGKSGMRD